MRTLTVLLTLALTGTALAGCLGGDNTDTDPNALRSLVPVQDRHLLPFNATGPYSYTLVEGVFGILDALDIFIDVELPATEGVAALTGDAKVHMGVFLPDIPGCDWESSDLPEHCQVPVIADIGPYYEDGDVAATTPANRLGKFLIENFVPHGYAVAQVSVFGSGLSTHCMDLMGSAEQAGVDAAVTYLGSEAWSNGAVGLIGRSYDGSTPWQAAMFGNPALKTIVPISGLIGMHELMWRNGTAEFRGPIMHNVVYGQFGIDSANVDPFAVLGLDPASAVQVNDPDPNDIHTLCPDYLTGPAQGAGAYATGDHFVPEVNDYWAERNFLPRVLENYQGSVYLIQGMQDWNVDPHMAFPTHHLLEEQGIEVKGLYGQWGHMYPDRPAEHVGLPAGKGQEASRDSPRFDWAEDLLEWFDFYLKGTGPKPSLLTEVQDNHGGWRLEETYPPRDASWMNIPLSDTTSMHSTPDIIAGVSPLGTGTGETSTLLEYALPVFENETRIAGTPRFHVTVTPTGPGGHMFADLYDKTDGLRIGHATMDLRFAAGGTESVPVVPGQPIVAKMEFFALDVVIPAGNELVLRITPSGEDYLPSLINTPILVDTSSASVLKIPTVERGPEAFFTPVQWDPCTFPQFVDGSENQRSRVNDLYDCSL